MATGEPTLPNSNSFFFSRCPFMLTAIHRWTQLRADLVQLVLNWPQVQPTFPLSLANSPAILQFSFTDFSCIWNWLWFRWGDSLESPQVSLYSYFLTELYTVGLDKYYRVICEYRRPLVLLFTPPLTYF